MDIKDIEKHGYLKLIEYTLKNNKYSIKQISEKTGLSDKQFRFAKHEIFVLNGHQESQISSNEVSDWELSPKSYFQYLEYLEFKYAVESSKKSTRIAIIAIIISGVLGLTTLIQSFSCSI